VQALPPSNLEFSTAIANSWACRTGLQSFSIGHCCVQPAALASLTQLQALNLYQLRFTSGALPEQLLQAVSKLSLLTALRWNQPVLIGCSVTVSPPSAAALMALAASTNLCSLQLHWPHSVAPQRLDLFQPGAVYPHLRKVDLHQAATCEGQPHLSVSSSCKYCAAAVLPWRVWPLPHAQAFPVLALQLGHPCCSCQR
jgi:hypothetical protein